MGSGNIQNIQMHKIRFDDWMLWPSDFQLPRPKPILEW